MKFPSFIKFFKARPPAESTSKDSSNSNSGNTATKDLTNTIDQIKRKLEINYHSQSRHNSKEEESIVKLIIKNDDLFGRYPAALHDQSGQTARKKIPNMFEQQRLILKSLYEIRRCRINNRDVKAHFK